MAQSLYLGLRNYKLDTINDHLEIEPFNHHRAVDDAMALAKIFCKMLEDLNLKGVKRVEQINTELGGGNKAVIKKKYYHLIILVRNQLGLKNLYKLVSEAHTNISLKSPRYPAVCWTSAGRACSMARPVKRVNFHRAIVDGRSFDELCRIAEYYDFLEVQPLGNNDYMLQEHLVDSIEKIRSSTHGHPPGRGAE